MYLHRSATTKRLRRSVFLLLCLAAVLRTPAPGQDRTAVEERLRFLDNVFKTSQFRSQLTRAGQPPPAEIKQILDDRRRKEWELRKALAPRESLGIVPLNDLGAGTYKGEQGGLYPGGRNFPPPSHAEAGVKIAQSIVPLNADGRPDPSGKIVLISIGYSNWTQEFSLFVGRATVDPERNPKVQVIDCAMGGISTEIYSHADSEYYNEVDQRLRSAGVTVQQVQVIMLKVATQVPWLPFPGEPNVLRDLTRNSVHVLKDHFPNLKVTYLTSRTYGGYADVALNPEPHAFETGFAVKWVIADQIAGTSSLNYDAAKGAVQAPWLAWGPYLWADGTNRRNDGLQWFRGDFVESDHTHPSEQGKEKVATLIEDFLKNDPTAKGWYTRQERHFQ